MPGTHDESPIERRGRIPEYRQLAAILRGRILAGTYPPGGVLPSENQLEGEFGISRNTSRRAIAILRDDGLIVTVPGRGSYAVSEDELRRHRE